MNKRIRTKLLRRAYRKIRAGETPTGKERVVVLAHIHHLPVALNRAMKGFAESMEVAAEKVAAFTEAYLRIPPPASR